MRVLNGQGLLSTDALTSRRHGDTEPAATDPPGARQAARPTASCRRAGRSRAPTDPPGQLATTIGAKLPDNFGEVVVYQSDTVSLESTLDAAQHALVVLKPGRVAADRADAVVCMVAAVLVAVDRRRAMSGSAWPSPSAHWSSS